MGQNRTIRIVGIAIEYGVALGHIRGVFCFSTDMFWLRVAEQLVADNTVQDFPVAGRRLSSREI